MKAFKKNKFFTSVQNQQVIDMFESEGCKHVRELKDADFVVFPGGSDVLPVLYGEKPLSGTHYSLSRDMSETRLYRSIPSSKPKIGICRGAQFLCVMNGGGLWQHVDGHTRDHPLWDLGSKAIISTVTSTHHQMMRLPSHAILLATAREATRKESDRETVFSQEKRNNYDDPEAAYFIGTRTLCFQPHPEYRCSSTKKYFFELFNKYIIEKGLKAQ